MKRFLVATPILLLLICATAAADSVTILLAPNTGFGGNFAFFRSGPGFGAAIFGGTETGFWDDTGFVPGTTIGLVQEIPVFIDGGSLVIGGNSVDFTPEGPASLLFLSSFTLPTNGKNFTTPVEMGFVADVLLSTGSPFEIAGAAGGKLTFDYYSPLGLYFVQETKLTTTPELGTLGLMITGLVGVIGVARSKLGKNGPRCRHGSFG